MRYGVPYKGSKNSIAKWIVGNLPKADTFVDLFCGGRAITVMFNADGTLMKEKDIKK